MKITLLEAGRPLTKTFKRLPDGTIEKTAYPNAYEFSSYEVSVHSLTQLAHALTTAAKKGWCLLKGNTQRPLVKESRAGSTDATLPTSYSVFDLDGAPFNTPDDFMAAVGLPDVSYVIQYSASSGFKTGLCAHIYTMLDQAVAPDTLKQYALWKNLIVPALHAGMTLTRTDVALRYPLDITANQNDKLIYLAAPQLTAPLVDPHGAKRIDVINKKVHSWVVPDVPSPDTLRVQQLTVVTSLRGKKGLPAKKFAAPKISSLGAEYMPNPGEAAVTGEKADRGFVYLNLNGGDSWGYWYPENNPEFLYNFKGEPTYKLSEICPTYWARLCAQANTGQVTSMGMIYLGVCDEATAAYHKVAYDSGTDTLEIFPARSKDQLKDFLKQHGQPPLSVVPDWSLVWDPRTDVRIDRGNRVVNRFEPSEYMKRDPLVVPNCPPTIRKVMLHANGGDAVFLDHEFNWLAFILQRRERTNTAFAKYGHQGTGKGVTFHRILTPIFGKQNVTAKRMEELESEFTGYMEGKLLVFIDEVQISRSSWHKKVTAKLKNLIAEPRISVRHMYQNAYMTENHANFIFASNARDPLEISEDDRRFNIAPYQPKPIALVQQDFDLIDNELFEFYSYLMGYPVDELRARTPLANSDRDELIKTNMLSIDVAAKALIEGNLDHFVDMLPQDAPSPNQSLRLSPREIALGNYKELMKDLLTGAPGRVLSRDRIQTLLAYCVDDLPESPNKLTSYLRHHNVRINPVWDPIQNKTIRGVLVNWTMPSSQRIKETLASL